MKKTDQSDLTLPLTAALSKADDCAFMPGEFAGMYQAGFEAGCKSAREAGYQQGFHDGFSSKRELAGQRATIDQMPNAGARDLVAVTPLPVEGQPATKRGPLDPDTRKCVSGPSRRRLLGLPCTSCRCFFYADEARCPICHTPRVTTAELVSATHDG
jgi:hypothetical protein